MIHDDGVTAAGLSGDEAAILAEFGYDSRYVARIARRRNGTRRLAEMVPLARGTAAVPGETRGPARARDGWATLGLLGLTVAVGVPYCGRLIRRVNAA